MRVYAIKDEVVGFTGAIMTAMNDDVVKRNMAIMVNEKGNQMNMWSKDFSAWFIGELDRTEGRLTEMQPQLVCRGNDLLIPERSKSDELRNNVQNSEN